MFYVGSHFFSQGSWIVKQSVGKKACLLGQALEINYFHGKNYLEVSLQELLFLYLCCVVWALSSCKMRARVCTRMYTHSNTCTHAHITQASSSCSPNSITFVFIGLAYVPLNICWKGFPAIQRVYTHSSVPRYDKLRSGNRTE